MSYLFFLGRNVELARAELSVFFPAGTPISDTVIRVQEDHCTRNGQIIPIADALGVLGGTVKIAEVLDEGPHIDPIILARMIARDESTHITFGVSTYEATPAVSKKEYAQVKELLEQDGRKVRFIFPQEHNILSGVAVAKQHVFEINIVKTTDGYLFSKTIAVQEFEEWADRDYGRPYFDSKKGMLPPKAARMAVNIGLGAEVKGKTVLDPFCGMGTIPGEAVLSGAIAMGSDVSGEAVEKAKKNSIWLRSAHPTLPPITYFVSDATHISQQIHAETIDVIVTEPYMGSPKLGEGKITDPKEIKNMLKGLEKLYIGCLREWKTILKPGGIIVMAIPEIVLGNTKYSVKNIIDSCERLGYTNPQGPFSYSRPQAVVRRMFYIFKK